jgi:hypothetical protein
VIEGTWCGYTSAQRRVVHRTVHSAGCRKLRAWAEKAGAIRFTDGTCLVIAVRDCEPRERLETIHGYVKLIDDCAHFDVTCVEDLLRAESELRRARANLSPAAPSCAPSQSALPANGGAAFSSDTSRVDIDSTPAARGVFSSSEVA